MACHKTIGGNKLELMKKVFFSSPKLWKDSAIFACVLVAAIETTTSIMAISLYDVINNWQGRMAFIAVFYVVLTICILVIKYLHTKKEITINVRGIKVTIKQGDIFQANGWRVIPFNEYFDTTVDDIIVAKNTLNGKFIIEHLDDIGIKELQSVISADDNSPLLKIVKKNERDKYPLGRIKVFRDYMLLAFARFNEQNEAHTTRAEYEHTLRMMWQEISRTYANKPVFLPLIGTGMTRFTDMSQKSNAEFLKCILCTLRTSNVTINQPITILLTEDALSTINLYELKGVQ